MPSIQLDSVDRRLLALLGADARLSYRQLGEAVGLSTAAAFQRVRKLEEAGIVRGYHAEVSPEALGRGVVAFLFLEATGGDDVTERLVAGWRSSGDAAECHRLSSGRYLVKVRLSEIAALEGFVRSATARGARVSAEIGLRTLFGDVGATPTD
jgi:Lrp/AsnC family leucine-responsive transcriptional regulator